MAAYTHAYAQTPAAKAPPASAPDESHQAVSVDSRPQLFAVMCALDAAGFESGAGTASDTPGTRAVAQAHAWAARTSGGRVAQVSTTEHALGDSGATFSRFVSFALVVGPPPDFQFELRRDDLPPEA